MVGVQFLEDFRAGQCGQRALKTVSTGRLAEGETAFAWKADRKGEEGRKDLKETERD